MHIKLIQNDKCLTPEYLPDALEHLRPAIGPLRFCAVAPAVITPEDSAPASPVGMQPGSITLYIGPSGSEWQPWQTTALDPGAPYHACIAVRSRPDWYPARGSWLLAQAILKATLQLLLGPEQPPHALPKTCLHHAVPANREEAVALVRGSYICKVCCGMLLSRGFNPFALDQLQEATQLVRAGLVRPQHYQPRAGRLLLAERQGQLVAELPDYGSRLPLEPLQLALYVLLLRHPGGVPAARSPAETDALTHELAGLYRRTNPNVTLNQAREKAGAALSPSRFSELICVINSTLTSHTPAAVADQYQILRHKCEQTGGLVRRIAFPGEYIVNLSGAVIPG